MSFIDRYRERQELLENAKPDISDELEKCQATLVQRDATIKRLNTALNTAKEQIEEHQKRIKELAAEREEAQTAFYDSLHTIAQLRSDYEEIVQSQDSERKGLFRRKKV